MDVLVAVARRLGGLPEEVLPPLIARSRLPPILAWLSVDVLLISSDDLRGLLETAFQAPEPTGLYFVACVMAGALVDPAAFLELLSSLEARPALALPAVIALGITGDPRFGELLRAAIRAAPELQPLPLMRNPRLVEPVLAGLEAASAGGFLPREAADRLARAAATWR